MAGPVEIEWSLDALADLDRFAAFLHGQFPELAGRVAGELMARADVLSRHPKLGRPIKHREEYREIVLERVRDSRPRRSGISAWAWRRRIGSVLGVLVAIMAGLLFHAEVFGVARVDVATLGGSAALLAAAMLMASLLPARRAARLDPIAVLREE